MDYNGSCRAIPVGLGLSETGAVVLMRVGAMTVMGEIDDQKSRRQTLLPEEVSWRKTPWLAS